MFGFHVKPFGPRAIKAFSRKNYEKLSKFYLYFLVMKSVTGDYVVDGNIETNLASTIRKQIKK